ncbi:glycosyltransferase family A protein [Neorhodopirellula pilleata]|uniref:Putative glycosyl transferase n=1 Tax=Neorhodopirellula pilleata TaxID=2714738 RepID=A0A5C6A8H3_9BACT|nr:glycosyltransferase family A protein [Neorhodopirellula pilleata]TWT96264.1 putative glycosyl transferase [Neorhodopirellula pilleata]
MTTVAFLTPNFNRQDLFPTTLASMQAQTLEDWECWLVDDGSDPENYDAMVAMCVDEPRVRVSRRNREPKGACTCRNIGAAQTEAKYVISLDTDDIIEPFCLQQRVDKMEQHPELDFAIFPSLMFEDEPNDLGLWWNIDTGEDLLERQFRQDAICQGTGSIWTTEAFRRIGMWSESLALWQDIDLYFRAYIQGYRYEKFFDLPPDLHNRCNHASLSRASFYNRAKQESRIQVVTDAIELLERSGKSDLRPWARYMVAEISNGNASARHFDLSSKITDFARTHKVINDTEYATLKRVRQVYEYRLYRLPGIKSWLRSASQNFTCRSLLGRVRVGDESKHLQANQEALTA